MMDFSKLTDKELENARIIVNAEIDKRKQAEEALARGELEKLLNCINDLQFKYDFEISCENYCCDWVESASNFKLKP